MSKFVVFKPVAFPSALSLALFLHLSLGTVGPKANVPAICGVPRLNSFVRIVVHVAVGMLQLPVSFFMLAVNLRHHWNDGRGGLVGVAMRRAPGVGPTCHSGRGVSAT